MKTIHLIPVFFLVSLLFGCTGNADVTIIPIDVHALQTAAVSTIIANITQTADAQPTLVATKTITPMPPTETATSTPASDLPITLCDNSAFISDASVIDGIQMEAGQEFVKTWLVKNTGTCLWKTGYQLIFDYGVKLDGLPVILTSEVMPGSEVEISVNLKAPEKPGNYSGYWRLANNNNVPFGQIFTVIISVP